MKRFLPILLALAGISVSPGTLASQDLAATGFPVVLLQEGTSAGAGTIRGVVRDQSGAPVPGANVMIRGTRIGCAAGVDGSYTISRLNPGAYIVVARCAGWAPVAKEVVVRAGQVVTHNVTLEQTSFTIAAIECVGAVDLL